MISRVLAEFSEVTHIDNSISFSHVIESPQKPFQKSKKPEFQKSDNELG